MTDLSHSPYPDFCAGFIANGKEREKEKERDQRFLRNTPNLSTSYLDFLVYIIQVTLRDKS